MRRRKTADGQLWTTMHFASEPSLACWRENHYVAILDKRGEDYRVFDAALNNTRWLPADAINARISGQFLAPETQVPENWRRLSASEAEQIVGGVVITAIVDDPGDEDCTSHGLENEPKCSTCPTNDCPPGNEPDDAGCSGCGAATDFSGYAMPVWRVSEPNIYLLIIDKPMFYTTSHDDLMVFKLTYKQRNTPKDTNIFGVGANWECNWRAFTRPVPTDTNQLTMYWLNGGERLYELSGSTEYRSNTKLTQPPGLPGLLMRTAKGQMMLMQAMTFTKDLLTLSFPTELDDSQGRTTSFQTTTNTSDYNGDNIVNRSVLITEPNGSKQLYLYRTLSDKLNPTNTTALIPSSYPAGDVPATDQFTNTFENSSMHERNSFYWGRQQYAALSASFRTNNFDFNNFFNLTTNDFNLARMKHWLWQGQSSQSIAGHTLSVLRMHSPDGVKEGQKTWFDYAGKPPSLNSNEGTNSRPAIVARVLPDTTSQYVHFDRNDWRNPTQIVSTYSTVGTNVLQRTNTLSYRTNDIDVLEVRGPSNELLLAYGNYLDHLPRLITNAVGEVTTLTYDSTNRQMTSIKWASGLTTTNIYFTSGPTNFLQQTKDLETTNSISFTYTNGLVNTFTDARGLTVTLNWDALERLTNAVFPNGTIKLTYTNLDLSTFVDRLTNNYNFTYNAIRQMTQTVDPLTRTNTYSYCDCGNLNSITDPLGRTTSFFYDTAGPRAD